MTMGWKRIPRRARPARQPLAPNAARPTEARRQPTSPSRSCRFLRSIVDDIRDFTSLSQGIAELVFPYTFGRCRRNSARRAAPRRCLHRFCNPMRYKPASRGPPAGLFDRFHGLDDRLASGRRILQCEDRGLYRIHCGSSVCEAETSGSRRRE